MADEHQFIENGLQRAQIDEFFAEELGRAGYGGMDIAKTPMGTQIVLKAEKPGMVIGKGGKNIRKITRELTERFDMDDPQIDVQEVDEPDLNARIVADRLANALERGWYFRKAGHTTIDRIMDAGALGAEIILSGKVTGARSRVEKFNRGYIKHNGEPAETVVDRGQSVAVVQLGTIGVTVRIIPPGAELPDDFRINEGVEVEPVEQAVETGEVEALLDEEAEVPEAEDVEIPDEDPDEVLEEEIVEDVEAIAEASEEVVEESDAEAADEEDVGAEEAPEAADDEADGETDDASDDPDEDGTAAQTDEALEEEIADEAAELVEEMESPEDADDTDTEEE